MLGRAPVAVNNSHVVLADRSGMAVNVYDVNDPKYPQKLALKVRANRYIQAESWLVLVSTLCSKKCDF